MRDRHEDKVDNQRLTDTIPLTVTVKVRDMESWVEQGKEDSSLNEGGERDRDAEGRVCPQIISIAYAKFVGRGFRSQGRRCRQP